MLRLWWSVHIPELSIVEKCVGTIERKAKEVGRLETLSPPLIRSSDWEAELVGVDVKKSSHLID